MLKRVIDPFPVVLSIKLQKKALGNNDAAHTILMSDGEIVVEFDIRYSLDDLLSTCIHEAVHVIQFLEQHIETELDMETQAYTTQDVACWMFQQIKKKKLKRKQIS